MTASISDVLEYIEENDVKFIRLAFCDIFGIQKNISIMPSELDRAFSEGISFDASAFSGFMNIESSDLLLFPDPTTLSILPWRPSHGRVVRFYCDIRYPDGKPFEGDGRYILRQAVRRLRQLNLECTVGPESEFYLFELDEAGNPTLNPHDQAGYFDIAPLDRAENVRRQICLTLEEMGIQPEASHHEQGPGQHEIDFKYSNPLRAADNLTTYKWVVKTAAASNGLFASFLPKPLSGRPGSGLHINLSLFRDGENVFDRFGQPGSEIGAFIAGILSRARELSVFLNPLTNSYDRFGEFEAPRFITWSHQNRSPLIRIPAASGAMRRMELRSPDGAINPYLAFALLIEAGIEGLLEGRQLDPPCDRNLFVEEEDAALHYPQLPADLGEALQVAEDSEFLRRILPERTLRSYLDTKRAEWERCRAADDLHATEREMYFIRF